MKIVKTAVTPYKEYKDLDHGSVFVYGDITFMKTNMGCKMDGEEYYYAVNLNDGTMRVIWDRHVVIPADDVSLHVFYRSCKEAERRWKKDKDE